jgi:hypothetical protein
MGAIKDVQINETEDSIEVIVKESRYGVGSYLWMGAFGALMGATKPDGVPEVAGAPFVFGATYGLRKLRRDDNQDSTTLAGAATLGYFAGSLVRYMM